MASIILPSRSPLTQQLRGKPSARQVKPYREMRLAQNSPLDYVRRFNQAAGFVICDPRQGNLVRGGPALNIQAGGVVIAGDLYGDNANITAYIGGTGEDMVWPRDTESPGGYEFTSCIRWYTGPDLTHGRYVGVLAPGSSINYWGVYGRYYAESSNAFKLGFSYVTESSWETGIIYPAESYVDIVVRSDAAGNSSIVINGEVVRTGTVPNPLYDRSGREFSLLCNRLGNNYGSGRAEIAGFSQNDIGELGALELSRNMFALVEPANQSPFLISVPAGGGVPTLSSPGVINVLSDRATPQVTLTF